MDKPVGLILAGGLSRRMGGGDKALRPLGAGTVLGAVVARVAPQVSALLLNANGDADRFGLDLPVIPDSLPDSPGPLAGLLAGLDHAARHKPAARFVLCVPADCPFLPDDLAVRLLQACVDHGSPAAIASSAGRRHPVVGLWEVTLRGRLRTALVDDDERRVGRFADAVDAVAVDWPTEPADPFFNVNTPEDLAQAERMLAAGAR
ncbi:molybdenum cofactor guanylyltransferase MobA [Ancylobacter sp. A5.8]|uniref:molybdenum cofactor guanylyltransferase MobA n=1 Tax=Ancylobacter gelatini TaxID=2919920 RepID=UPI001F4EC5B1|nr:molybdenum cofactor guanylyltransferase MobA [Ancylobacter gelatini]MCJ8141652.1 molybdenum cofactor guanylyltransferase MobA [Ancylobacter gelatini]